MAGAGGGSAAQLAELSQRVAALESALREERDNRLRLETGTRQALADRKRMLAEIEGLRASAAKSDRAREHQIAALVRRMEALSARLGELESVIGGLNQAARAAESEARAVRALINQEAARDLDETDGASASALAAAAGGETFGVHLASYRDAEKARAGWQVLLDTYPELLKGLAPRLEPFDLGTLGGRYLRLVAGPFADVAPARERCEALRAAGAFCQVAAFRGEPLG
ncbi:MAG: hypothetical protein D6807_03190 [Alphaproteobacteria bacterium]|nr:MAG: hypothetical protein D6807_03190 [Alphaproteobacteria bacterium]